MSMAGIANDEDAFDELAERMVLTGRHAARIPCPTLLVTGEFDPLSPIEHAKAVYDELGGPKELWVRENNFHKSKNETDLAGAQIEMFIADWLRSAVDKGLPAVHAKTVYVRARAGDPYH